VVESAGVLPIERRALRSQNKCLSHSCDGRGVVAWLIRPFSGVLAETVAASTARYLAAAALFLAAAGALFPGSAWAQTLTLTKLHDFTKLDGSYPAAGLLRASDGNFYGTTPTGGPGANNDADYGTVFRITPTGEFTNLVNFTSDNGSNPYAPPIEGSDGNLYGTTAGGGGISSGVAKTRWN
jgi:uncharacterized repeat protein (TIGR03803 family)